MPLTYTRPQMAVYCPEALERPTSLKISPAARTYIELVEGTRAAVRYNSRKPESEHHTRPDCSGGRHGSVLVTWVNVSNRNKAQARWRLCCDVPLGRQGALLCYKLDNKNGWRTGFPPLEFGRPIGLIGSKIIIHNWQRASVTNLKEIFK